MWVRKSCGNLSNAGHDSLLPQGRHRLPYLIALSLHPLFGSYCSMREILSRNLCTLLGKATNEGFRFRLRQCENNMFGTWAIRASCLVPPTASTQALMPTGNALQGSAPKAILA